MYIPSLFTTNPNGCPDGFRAYKMANFGTTNLNTGARGRLTVNINKFTTDVVRENFQGIGSYNTNIILNINGGSYSTDGIEPPGGNVANPGLPFWGSTGQNQSTNYYITSSAGEQLYYCYDCTKKWRWTIGSNACQSAPWPAFSTPLTLAVLTTPNGSLTSDAAYTKATFDFCAGTTGTIEGYGPIWERNALAPIGNSATYYIVSRQDITPRYYGIENCLTSSVTRSISLSGTTSLNVGDVFKSSTSGLSGSCWSVTSSFQSASFTPNIANVVTASTFAACINCTDPLSIKYNITDCSTSINYVTTFSSIPTIGSIFKSLDLEKCFTIVSQANQTASLDYSNLVPIQTYADCATCEATYGTLQLGSLIIGGGGAGGGYYGGGGGGGQYQTANFTLPFGNTYSIVVGAGGVAGDFKGTNGDSSSFNGVISIGGGAGGAIISTVGNDGASGGGGSRQGSSAGGTGTAGNNGGTATSNYSGGGGGSSQAGANGSSTSNGGNGTQWVDGNYYAGGGGGYRTNGALTNAIGGLGGGGIGEIEGQRDSTSGSVNTGGGGGGAGQGPTGTWSGGSGVVKIRYAASSSVATGGTITVSGSYVYHTFTGSGNFTT
jgi:hypothetical protein